MYVVAFWHSPATRLGEPDYFLTCTGDGACKPLYTLRASKRWLAITASACSMSSRTTVSQLAAVLRSAQNSGVQLELHAVEAPNLPTVRLSATVGKQHVASVLLTQAEWAQVRSAIMAR